MVHSLRCSPRTMMRLGPPGGECGIQRAILHQTRNVCHSGQQQGVKNCCHHLPRRRVISSSSRLVVAQQQQPQLYQQQQQQQQHYDCRRYYSDKGRRNSSSSEDDNNNNNNQKQKKNTNRSGPVSVGRTPRANAAASSRRQQQNDTTTTTTTTVNHQFIYGADVILPSDPIVPPFQLANFGEESLYTLVLLRHGESEWNKSNKYTGWCDVNLTLKGKQEARDAGRLLYENGIELDHAFTSVLRRASFSCNMALNTAKQHWVPVTKSWRLNERHYGALQGYNKDTAFQELNLDQELVMQMRRSYDVRPIRMEDDHPYWHGNDRRYAKLSPEQLERTRAESLKDTADRIMPFYNSLIVPTLRAGNKCIIVSHANTIRTLIKQIDNISDEDIKGMSIPTGIPLLYRLDKHFRPVDPIRELEFRYMVEPKGYTWGTDFEHGFHGVYLGDLERLQDIQLKRDASNRNWQRIILYKIARSLLEDDDSSSSTTTTKATTSSSRPSSASDTSSGRPTPAENRKIVFETRQLWWQIHTKMQEPEYGNMLLLVRMKDELEHRMYSRKQKVITFADYDELVNKLHLDAEGHVVEPFVAISDREDRDARQRLYYDSLAQELEEECLIK